MQMTFERNYLRGGCEFKLNLEDHDLYRVPESLASAFSQAQGIAGYLSALANIAAWLDKEEGSVAPIEGTWEPIGVDMAGIGEPSQTVKGLLTEGEKR